MKKAPLRHNTDRLAYNKVLRQVKSVFRDICRNFA